MGDEVVNALLRLAEERRRVAAVPLEGKGAIPDNLGKFEKRSEIMELKIN